MYYLRQHELEQGKVLIKEEPRNLKDLDRFIQVSIALSLKRIADALEEKNS